MRIIYPTARLSRYAPERIAAMDGKTSLTYGELEVEITRDAQRLGACGIRRGDRIAIAAANSLDWVSLIHAAVRVGAILAPLNTRLSPSEIRRLIQVVTPKVLLADAPNAARLFIDDLDESMKRFLIGKRIADEKRTEWTPWTEAGSIDVEVPQDVALDDTCAIIGTSGSSGEPKLVALSYGNLHFSALASAINLGHQPTDRWLINLPLFHVGGMSIVHRAAVSGFGIVLGDHFDPATLFDRIDDYEITHLSVVATMLKRVLEQHENARCPQRVRAVLVGGGGIDPALMKSARELGYPVLATYGMTETASQAATQSPSAADQPIGAARPLPMCEVRIREESCALCKAGVAGQVCVRGPMVAAGYWQPNETVASILEDGWFVTEDLGTLDERGYLHVLGRCDDVIISGGENVSLREIEQTAIQCTGVHRVAALAIDDSEWGQASVLFVEAIETIQADTIEQFLREHLARYKLPQRIICLGSLPTTALDKVDRSALYIRLAQLQES